MIDLSERRLEVLVVGLSWPPESFLERLLAGLAEHDMRLWIASREPQPVHDPTLELDGVAWLPMPSDDAGRPRRWRQRLASGLGAVTTGDRRQRARRLLRAGRARGFSRRRILRCLPFARRRFDLIYFPWNLAAVDHPLLFDLGAPVLISCRGAQINIAPHDPARAEFARRLPQSFAAAAAVHCVSRDICRQAQGHGLDPTKATVITPAIDIERFVPPPVARSVDRSLGRPFQLITTGSLTWRKRHTDAIQAVARLRRAGHDVELDIIGDGACRQELLYTADDLGVAAHVRLSGRLATDQVVERLHAADAFVLTSVSEGISNAVLEAMACGLSVVTTDCGGMSEALDDGVEGLIVPVRQPAALASAVERLITDPELAARLGSAARGRVEREFRLRDQITAFADLCRAAASVGSPAAGSPA